MKNTKQIPTNPKKLEEFLLNEILLANKEYYIFSNFPYDVKEKLGEDKFSEFIMYNGDEIKEKLKSHLDFIKENPEPGELENFFSIFQNVFPPNTTNKDDYVLSQIDKWREIIDSCL